MNSPPPHLPPLPLVGGPPHSHPHTHPHHPHQHLNSVNVGGGVNNNNNQPERSKNAVAQARHRAKRKAYIEQLEETVARLQQAIGLSDPNGIGAIPPPLRTPGGPHHPHHRPPHLHPPHSSEFPLPSIPGSGGIASGGENPRVRALELEVIALRDYAENLRSWLEQKGERPPPIPMPSYSLPNTTRGYNDNVGPSGPPNAGPAGALKRRRSGSRGSMSEAGLYELNGTGGSILSAGGGPGNRNGGQTSTSPPTLAMPISQNQSVPPTSSASGSEGNGILEPGSAAGKPPFGDESRTQNQMPGPLVSGAPGLGPGPSSASQLQQDAYSGAGGLDGTKWQDSSPLDSQRGSEWGETNNPHGHGQNGRERVNSLYTYPPREPEFGSNDARATGHRSRSQPETPATPALLSSMPPPHPQTTPYTMIAPGGNGLQLPPPVPRPGAYGGQALKREEENMTVLNQGDAAGVRQHHNSAHDVQTIGSGGYNSVPASNGRGTGATLPSPTTAQTHHTNSPEYHQRRPSLSQGQYAQSSHHDMIAASPIPQSPYTPTSATVSSRVHGDAGSAESFPSRFSSSGVTSVSAHGHGSQHSHGHGQGSSSGVHPTASGGYGSTGANGSGYPQWGTQGQGYGR